MAIFNQKKSSPSSPSAQRPRPMERQTPDTKPRSATYIAAGSKVTGEISGSAEVLVDGLFDGCLKLDSNVVVGREGRVNGEITARAVRVEGKVTGDVRGHERVEVMASGTLEGDISATRVVIAEGAYFKGKVEMASQHAPKAEKDTKKPGQNRSSGYGKKKPNGPPQQQNLSGRDRQSQNQPPQNQPPGGQPGAAQPAEASAAEEPQPRPS